MMNIFLIKLIILNYNLNSSNFIKIKFIFYFIVIIFKEIMTACDANISSPEMEKIYNSSTQKFNRKRTRKKII